MIQTETRRWISVYLNLAHVYRQLGKMEMAQRMLHQVEVLGGPEAVNVSE